MITTVNTILIGKVDTYGLKGELSAYKKNIVEAPITISTLGLDGDEQADLKHHGGTDKAILHYAHDHYSFWRNHKPEINEHLQRPGAFGENISTKGITEDQVCIGDRYKLGTAIVEVSQGRQPCWKLGHYFNDPQMVKDVVKTGYCGWYYRVVEEGNLEIRYAIELLDRPNPQWTVAKVFSLLIAGEKDLDALNELYGLNELSEHWKARALKLISKKD